MLKNAYGNVTGYDLNKLIREGNYKYLNFSTTRYFEEIELEDDDWNKIQKVSISDGKVLGFFQAEVNSPQQKITSTYFVKFRYKYETHEYKDSSLSPLELVVKEDFEKFVDEIMNHPLYNRVTLMAIKDNHANKTYEKWLDKYNGERFLLKDYARLKDGRFYDVFYYWFRRGK